MDLATLKTLSPREYHARRDAERREARETLRESKLQQARESICRIAPLHPAVRRVYLFGSVLRPGRFRADSDIDIAIECDELEAETPFARALERELGMAIDLRPFVGAIVEAVRHGGEKVYG